MNSVYLAYKSIGGMVDMIYGDSYPQPITLGGRPLPIQRSKPVSLQNLQPIFNC